MSDKENAISREPIYHVVNPTMRYRDKHSSLEQYKAGKHFEIARSIKGTTRVGMALTLRKGIGYQQFRITGLLARRLSPMISSKGVNGETRVVAEKRVYFPGCWPTPLRFLLRGLGLNNTT